MNIFLNKKSINKATLVTSVGLFILSLSQQCYCTTSHCAYSIAVLFSGSFGFFLCLANLTWLANPLLLVSWKTINRNPLLSLITSLLATIISFSFLLFTNIMDNEGGFYSKIIGYKLGYWLWVSSSLIMFVGNMIGKYAIKEGSVSK